MAGHCRHCHTGPDNPCTGDARTKRHYDGHDAKWHAGACPACAEAERIAIDLRKSAANYRDTERMLATTEPQTPGIRESREFFKGCAEALEWTLADIAGDHFDWISGGDE